MKRSAGAFQQRSWSSGIFNSEADRPAWVNRQNTQRKDAETQGRKEVPESSFASSRPGVFALNLVVCDGRKRHQKRSPDEAQRKRFSTAQLVIRDLRNRPIPHAYSLQEISVLCAGSRPGRMRTVDI